ncbi:anion exchange protein 3-like isoform X2 [Physella acuta]|uniref:anion exchange protein 3-like isoform X2 n=1 Tax=Physella acuta TaxID=109671 RepID=UPI0027DB5515|nr:anion exchange protein 3-like isoform X2 [Physella acuta]
MAFHGRDKSRTGGDPDESIPLTSDQDGMNLDSTPSSGSLVAEILANGAEDGPPRSLIMRSVSTEPIISRGVTLDDENVTRLSFLHDEVEKIFDTDWRYDSTTLTTDPNSKAQALNLMGRESSKLSLSESYHVDEAEYSRHRKVSYPHIHQPLRSLSNKSLSKSHKSHKEKKKAKKKKKKEKLRSFPSQGAIKSPTIPEEEEEHFDPVDDDSDSGSSSVTDDDEYDEEYNRETEGDVSSKQEPYETTIELKIQPATPSPADERDIQLDQSKLAQPRPKDAVDFFIGADFPSPISESQEQPFPVASTPFIESQPASSSVQAASDEETGFMSDPGLSSFSEEIALQTLKKSLSEDPGNFNSKQEVEEATPSFRPAYLALDVADDRGTPSPMAHMPPREQSLTGKVTFVVGDDSSYPSYAAFQTQMAGTVPDVEQGGEPSGGDEEDDDDDKENVWKRKKRRDSGGHRRGSTEGYTQESETHDLQRVPSVEGSQSTRSSKRRHHHHHEHFHREDLIMRRQKGSEVKLDQTFKKSPTEIEEASMLYKSDLDEMASHRFEDQRGIRRHKIARSKGALRSIVHIGKSHHIKKHKVVKKFDHSPHEVFVELDELHIGSEDMWEWREKARWIKFEEDVEEGAERWGKPHVASLSFHSLLELRRGLENGTVLLDLEATDLTSIIHNVTENMVIRDLVEEEVKGKLLRTLLLKHKHVSGRSAFLRRNPSYSNLTSLDNAGKRHQQNNEKGLLNSLSQSSFGSNLGLSKSASTTSVMDRKNKDNKAAAKLEMVKVDVDNNMTDKQTDGVHIGITPVEQKKHVQDIMRRIPKGAEASNVLVGQVDFLKKPAMAFVRLAEGQLLENLTEVPLPVRFLFILLGPDKGGMDYHEVGRSFATLMSNQQFHDVAYRAESREDLLRAINSFLDDSIVLPPGDWDHRTLLPITHMARKRALLRKQKKQQLDEKEALLEKEDIPTDPLKRTGCLFGGVYNDIRRRYPHYLSDIKDAFNGQCIKTLFFIFFTCLSPCIAFGGLLSEKTNSYMGVSETMLATSIFGMIFSLFSGQPLLIIGATGPVLVFEESLYKFCTSNSLEFLPLRFWIGLWVFAITTLAVALEGSFLVRYVTRFVEEIFAILISLIFIYEVVKKLVQIFSENPLMVDYCQHKVNKTTNETFGYNSSLEQAEQGDNYSYVSIESTPSSTLALYTSPLKPDHEKNQPNTALLSLILVFGTFLIAYFLRIFRNSKFLGRSVRRALGDFGVLIALVCMVILSFIMKATYVQKLDMTDPLEPTSPDKRGWFINPMGSDQPMPVWLIFGSALPGFLIFILLFMETQITEMILNKKERKLKKGSGYHIDQLILGFLTFLGGLFGLPWMCAATVRTVAHISALSVYSSTHAPGEKPQLLGVKEQRVTNFCVHLLIGVSVAAGPVLREVPVPALFGVFLYLGVSTLNGVQMFERIKLLFMPVKYHPSVVYVRKVRTSQMHKFTLIQLACLIILIVIKSTAAALAFPFLLVLLMPLRLKLVSRWFSKDELEHLDMEEEDFELDDEDDPDFYQQAHMPI